MSVAFYQSRLIDLLRVSNPTRLMKRVIDTLESNTEKVYIYDTNTTYASLFLSDDTRTIYFYPNLQCSLLKPPDKPFTPHWNIWIDRTSVPPLNMEWVHSILLLNAKERFESDKDILQDKPRTIRVALVDDDNYIRNKIDTKTHLRINSAENTHLLKNIRALQNMRLYKKVNLSSPILTLPLLTPKTPPKTPPPTPTPPTPPKTSTPTPPPPPTPKTPPPKTPPPKTLPPTLKEQARTGIPQLFIPKLQRNTTNRPKWK